ncbi:MAG: hypothetical protein PHF29_06705 [Candidatus Riflebacteria bacterium]|nr:hypothetical protein [Candidatus Riflebacteria bacterium]
MKKSTIKSICTLLCVVMMAGFAFEAPLMADASAAAIAVNVGGKTVNVTPGQWVTVNNGNTTASYNVRYVNGKAVALDLQQYTSLVFGDSAASSVAGQVSQSASQASQASQVAQSAADTTAASQASGAKGTSGSWIKEELGSYGTKISDSYKAGKETGQSVGTKTVEGTKSFGSKIGNLLKSAKDKITGLFKKSTPAKAESKPSQSEQASQTSQSSEQSSQASQSEQASQTNQSSEQSSQAAQSEQASQANQSSEQSSQAAQSEQASQASQQASQASEKGSVASGEKKGLFSKISGKVKSGYQAGKAMANQGVQNVKDSLKSGFSAKNLLVTAGITVGVDLATQLMRGEDLSVKKALKTVVCAEFAGSVVGSVTGAAAGSFFTPFLSAIPVVGGVLSALAPTFGSIVGSSVGSYLAGDIKNGRFSLKSAIANIDWAGVVGQTIGSTAGAALGSFLGPVGTVIGGMVGGYIGNWAAQKLKSLFGGKDSFGSIGMPVGTVSSAGSIGGVVSVGSVAGNTSSAEIPVSASNVTVSDEIPVAASAADMGSYSSEVQLAEAKYQELYKLYNEMLSEGRQADAITVAQEMNKAKAAYEALLAND